MLIFRTCISIVLFLISFKSFSQSELLNIENQLVNKEFRNISVVEINDSLNISVENLAFRHASAAVSYIYEQLNNRIPIRKIEIKYFDFSIIEQAKLQPKFAYSIDNEYFKYSAPILPFFTEIIFEPQIKSLFGKYDDPIRFEINVAPLFKTRLWKGAVFNTQIVFPVYNNLNNSKKKIRPEILNISQFIKLKSSQFFSFSFGNFSNNRFGFSIENYSAIGKGFFHIRGGLGLTGYSEFIDDAFFIEKIDYLTYYMGFSLHFDLSKTVVEIFLGKFLYDEQGMRLNIYRNFGELELGFFGYRSFEYSNFGFFCSLPLFQKGINVSRFINLRTPHYFNWEYKTKAIGNRAEYFNTGNELHNVLRRFLPL